MIKDMIELEIWIDEKKKENELINEWLANQNIKKLLCEIYEEDFERIAQWTENEIGFKFFEKGNHLNIYYAVREICIQEFGLPDVINQIQRRVDSHEKEDEIKKILVTLALLGFVELNNLSSIPGEVDTAVAETAYIVENVLFGVYEKKDRNLPDNEVAVNVKEYNQGFWVMFEWNMVKTVQDIKSKFPQESIIAEINKHVKEKIEEIDKKTETEKEGIEKIVEEKFHGFYMKMIELMGIFVAIFSLIGFNLFRENELDVISTLLMNLSCVLALVVMFILIDYLVNKEEHRWKKLLYLALILGIALVIIA